MNEQLKAAQKRIEKITAALEEELGIGQWWEIRHYFSEDQDGSGEVGADGMIQTEKTMARTVTQWHYRKAEITWYLPSIAIRDDDYVEWVAVHEYVHVLNDPIVSFLFDYLRDDEPALEQIRSIGHHAKLCEFVTENLARVIQKSRGKDVPA